MGCIALVRCVLVLRCFFAVVVWYPYVDWSLHTDTTPPQRNHNVTPTHIEPEQYNPWNNSTNGRKLLRMDVLTSETCWALNNEIIKQETSSWSLFNNQDDVRSNKHKILKVDSRSLLRSLCLNLNTTNDANLWAVCSCSNDATQLQSCVA